MKNKINLLEPSLFKSSKKLLQDCVEKNEISTHSNNIIEKFEKKISILSGSKYTIAVNSGSVALYLSFKCLGIRPNDLIIMPSYTFIATATSAIHAGGLPWFFDVGKDQLTIDLEQVEKALENETYKRGKFFYHKKTKRKIFAICPVYTLGFLPDLKKIREIGKKYNLKVIADAASALGSKFIKGKLSKYNDAVCYSFNGNKSFTAGGGGAISINSNKFRKDIFLMSSNGKTGDYYHKVIGHNFRITGIHAALGLGQIMNFNKIKSLKEKINKNYLEFFKKNNLKTFYPKNRSNIIQWFNFFMCQHSQDKNKILKHMNKYNINLKNFWRPLHLQPCIEKSVAQSQKNTNEIWKKIIILPSSNNLKVKELKYIQKRLIELF